MQLMNSNFGDGGSHKYILIEMGEYFENATMLRVKRHRMCSRYKSMENGKPQNRNTGISQIIKYMRLESYEDALSNIELSDNGGQLKSLLGEDYLIHYMVDLESRWQPAGRGGVLQSLRLHYRNKPYEVY